MAPNAHIRKELRQIRNMFISSLILEFDIFKKGRFTNQCSRNCITDPENASNSRFIKHSTYINTKPQSIQQLHSYYIQFSTTISSKSTKIAVVKEQQTLWHHFNIYRRIGRKKRGQRSKREERP